MDVHFIMFQPTKDCVLLPQRMAEFCDIIENKFERNDGRGVGIIATILNSINPNFPCKTVMLSSFAKCDAMSQINCFHLPTESNNTLIASSAPVTLRYLHGRLNLVQFR